MIFELNRDWIFTKANGESYSVTLPHDAMLTEKRYAESRNGVQSGYFPGGKYSYSRVLHIPEEYIGKDIRLLFEGVYRNATVSVNGKNVAYHTSGYSEFEVNISDAVEIGDNTLTVDVDNSLVPNCRWYSGSGIYRPVWLKVNSKDAPSHLKVRTVSYNPPVIEVMSDSDVEIDIIDDGKVIASGGIGRYTIEGAKLWSHDNPYLYTCIARRGGESIESTFGIRHIEWSGKIGLTINGEQVLLRGGCIHHDNGVLGACTYPDAEERRVRILKEQGFNTLRISHNPASRALLDACDRQGMLVIDEAFDGWYIPKDYHDYSRDFYDGYKADLAAMVNKDYNHPSVIMYSLGNEVTETASQKGVALCSEMRDIVRSLDDSRPVTCGVNVLLDVYIRKGFGVYKDKGEYRREPLPEDKRFKEKRAGSSFFNYWAQKLGKLMFYMSKGKLAESIVSDIAPAVDIVGLNYASSRYDIDAVKYPDRVMLGTETMVGDLPYNWSRVRKYPQLIGDCVWSAWDYIGEACIGDWTYYSYKGLPLLAGQGMIDITGNPKAQMGYMQVVWGLRAQPYIAVRPLNHSKETPKKSSWQFTDAIASWNWQGYEGAKAKVEVYADADTVRLELNGKVVGEAKVKDYIAKFTVGYECGELRAIALDKDGRELSASVLISGNETYLSVRADKTLLNANGQDLCHLEIEFVDENGNVCPLLEQRVEIKTHGDGAILQGFGSALCKTDEVFDKTYHDSYRGRLLAVFRATHTKGKTVVTVQSKGVKEVTLELEVI